MNQISPLRIFLLDDHPYSRIASADLLRLNNYQIIEGETTKGFSCGQVVEQVEKVDPDLVLMDVNLAHQNGIELCQAIKHSPVGQYIPIILTNAMDDPQCRLRSRASGADAYLLKPLERVELLNQVDLLIQKKKLAESVAQIEQVLFRLAAVIEERYAVGEASITCSQLIEGFGEFIGLEQGQIDDLVFAARLHDLGLIQVPDEIMLKQGPLNSTELDCVRDHVHVAATIFEPLAGRRAVGEIMRYHHERWDGSGYPDALRGKEIPLLAQVFQIIDIFTALTSNRRYKEAVNTAQALEILQGEARRGWRNPEMVEKFVNFINKNSIEESLAQKLN
ncbi:regulatory components of sensory transduction system [Synechocystis sp. PCC 6803]|uniref:Regulatory components of sensory transduction system n=1 Tax=Synechocystis sp. (strain ATCC 27184 / PCC 6803 / Kazusa) TaxID=1111708 RepID=P73724_SYNY3|nr:MULTISPECIES: two-component system response regulator [unclassified Synechocystis]MBD2617482.1 two-component system response regulator [Synechocystis sp. FACHB-898]MBD2638841.1 two-component system response regulator [Synechocystis sp. FACHB-908]MBD2660088.1 two-component system response regulator [Synechocystis sp. FACHB-929]BAM51524.1 regulatory components of sensory transductionsystem [Synechocystis sp. PCC 6803] [Bacillus subtilis BEST7613]AGF51460.1 regulatory components of sensory tra